MNKTTKYDNVPGIGLVSQTYIKLETWLKPFLEDPVRRDFIKDKYNQISKISAETAFDLVNLELSPLEGKVMRIMTPFEYVDYIAYLMKNNPNKVEEIEQDGRVEILDGIYSPNGVITPGTIFGKTTNLRQLERHAKNQLPFEEFKIDPYHQKSPLAIYGAGMQLIIDSGLYDVTSFRIDDTIKNPERADDPKYGTTTFRPVLIDSN